MPTRSGARTRVAEGFSWSGTTRSAGFLLRGQPSISLRTNTVYPSIASRKLCIAKRDETIEAMFEQSNVAFSCKNKEWLLKVFYIFEVVNYAYNSFDGTRLCGESS